jgi:iron complex transport system substrate-binding protein
MRIIILAVLLIMSLSSGAFAASLERIISLTPSTTELLFALGLGDRIVGVTNACLYPAAAKSKFKIGSMVAPSLEVIISQRPDIVVGSSDSVSLQLIDRLKSLNINAYVIPGYNLARFPGALREFGAAVGKKRQAERMAGKIEREIANIRKSSALNTGKRSVLYLVWTDPPLAAGAATPIHEAIELLGLNNAGVCSPAYYPACSLEDIISRAPDIIVIGSAHADMREQSGALLNHLRMLKAVREGRVYYVSDNLFRLGPRFVDGLRELREILK